MKKKLMSMGFTSLEILSNSEKKMVKGGYGPNPGYFNNCVTNGPVKCVNTQYPSDRYFYCDMATCQMYCGGSVVLPGSVSSYCTY
jgi:hypothetical protein